MEHLKDKERFITYKEDEDLPNYVRKIVFWLEVHVFNRISKRVNWLLDRHKDDSFEITRTGNAIDTNGNFKIERNGEDWEVKIKSGGTWTTVWIFYGS